MLRMKRLTTLGDDRQSRGWVPADISGRVIDGFLGSDHGCNEYRASRLIGRACSHTALAASANETRDYLLCHSPPRRKN